MGKHMVANWFSTFCKVFLFRLGLGITSGFLLLGCHPRNASAQANLSGTLKIEQTQKHVVIGRKDDHHFEYFDMTAGGALRVSSFAEQPPGRFMVSIDLN